MCRLAEETAKSGNKVLLADEYKREAKLKMANTVSFGVFVLEELCVSFQFQMMPIFEDALYTFNVLRIPSLRTLFENAVAEKRFLTNGCY